MKSKIFVIFIMITIILTGCGNKKHNNNEPFKYIAISSSCDADTQLIKIGNNNKLIQSSKSKKDSIALGAFMKKPQAQNGMVYYAASATEKKVDYGVLELNPKTLEINSVPGMEAATSFFIDGDDVYTACAYPENSYIVKANISDSYSQRNSFLKGKIDGIVNQIFEDDDYIYTLATEDPAINFELVTVTKIDKKTLKSLDKYVIPNSKIAEAVLVTEENIFFAITESPLKNQNRKAENIEGYKTDVRDKDLSEICRYNKKTKEFSIINLPFAFLSSLSIVDNYLYAVSTGGYDGQFGSLAIIDLTTNKIERAINLPYYCFESYTINDMFVALDGYNIYEYDLTTMKLLNTIKLTDDTSKRFNTFVTSEQIERIK